MKTVRSKDSTPLAFEKAGDGPALILIGGAFCDRRARAAGTPLAALIAPDLTVFSYDRRGRGDSGDTPRYTLDREIEDLEALIAEAGGRASVYGISSGGLLALEGAAQGLPIDKVVVYEAPLVLDPERRASQDIGDELAELAARGRRSEAAELFLVRVVGMPPPVVAGMKQAPMWAGLEALAHTLSHDVRLASRAPALLERLPSVHVPSLVLDGERSPAWMREGSQAIARALGNGHHQHLAGQTHDVDPAVLAPVIRAFVRG